MIRNFTSDPVDDGILKRIPDALRRHTSGRFTRGQDDVVVRDSQTKMQLARLVGRESLSKKGLAHVDFPRPDFERAAPEVPSPAFRRSRRPLEASIQFKSWNLPVGLGTG